MKNDRGVPFWLDRELMISFDRVSSDMNVDVAIIGAGIVGLHAACQLRQSGLRVAIFEARKIGRQATGRSTDLAGRFLLTNAAFENMADRSAEDLKRLGRHELINP